MTLLALLAFIMAAAGLLGGGDPDGTGGVDEPMEALRME